MNLKIISLKLLPHLPVTNELTHKRHPMVCPWSEVTRCLLWMNSRYDKTAELNTLRPRQNGCHFADIFRCIFFYESGCISINISLKFVPKGQIDNIPALVQTMAWLPHGDKLLSEPMMVSLLTHLCVTRPQWVNLWKDQGKSSIKISCLTSIEISIINIKWSHDHLTIYTGNSFSWWILWFQVHLISWSTPTRTWRYPTAGGSRDQLWSVIPRRFGSVHWALQYTKWTVWSPTRVPELSRRCRNFPNQNLMWVFVHLSIYVNLMFNYV